MLIWGIFSMVMVGAGWCIFGYLMGEVPKRKIDVTAFLLIFTFLKFLLCISVALFQRFPDASLKTWGIGVGVLILSGVANYFQLDFMARAMKNGPNGIVWTIAQSGFIFPFAMGIILFNVPLFWLRAVGFAAILISLIMLGAGGDNRSSGRWKIWALGAFFATGCNQCLNNLPSYFAEAEVITPMWRTAAWASGLMLGCFMIRFKDIPALFRTSCNLLAARKDVWWMSLLGGVSGALFSFFFLYPGMDILARIDAGAIAYPIMVCSCLIVFELYSIIFLKEKRSISQIAALLICLAGVAGICTG